MKRIRTCFFSGALACSVLFSGFMTGTVWADDFSGKVVTVDESGISGWVSGSHKEDISLDIQIFHEDSKTPEAEYQITADALKGGSSAGRWDFQMDIDWSCLDNSNFIIKTYALSDTLKIRLSGTDTYSSAGPAFSGADTDSENTESEAAAEDVIVKDTVTENVVPGTNFGTFKTTGYCNCSKCSGQHSLTYSGTVPQANHTVAADLNVFPIGTKLLINGITYTVEDKGSGVNGNVIDIFYDSHTDALSHGVQYEEVFAAEAAE